MSFVLWIIMISFFMILALYSVICMIRADLKKDPVLKSLVTGLIVISSDNKNTEILLRSLASYIQKNDIRCFRKIYIRVDRNDTDNIMICRSMCDQYYFYELLYS